MKTIETKIAKNGAVNTYVNGKKMAIAKAAEMMLRETGARDEKDLAIINENGETYLTETWVIDFVYRDNAVRELVDRIKKVAHGKLHNFNSEEITETKPEEETEMKNQNTNATQKPAIPYEVFMTLLTGKTAEQRAAEIAEENRQRDISDCKYDIRYYEGEITRTTGNLQHINGECEKYPDDESLKAYAAELTEEIATLQTKLADTKIKLAELTHEADVEDYAVSTEAQDAAIEAEIENATRETLPTGSITVDSGAKAFEIAAKYFPNGLKFKSQHKWVNGAYEYTFTDGNDMYLHATCDRDNTRVEFLEVVNTNENGSKRKPLFVIINPPENSAPETPNETPAENESEDDFKLYPIDVAIYHGGDILTDDQLEVYAAQFREAITANGNFGKVEIEESYLSVYGNTGGDNKTIWKLIGDLCWRGECCLESFDAEYPHECREMPGEEIDAMLARMGIDNDPPAFVIPEFDAAVKKVFGDDAPAFLSPSGTVMIEVANTPETPDEDDEIIIIAQNGGKLTIEGGMPEIAANGNKLEVNGITVGEYYTNVDAQEAAEALITDIEEFGNDHPVLNKEYFAEIELEGNATGGDRVTQHLNANAPEGWTVQRVNTRLHVNFNGEFVAKINRITDRDLFAPHDFFKQFQSLVDHNNTPENFQADALNAQIDCYLNTAYDLEGMAEELEIICNNFDDDAQSEQDWHVASRISFYVDHVKRGIEGLREMIEWYKQRAEFNEGKLKEVDGYLDSKAE